MVKLKTLLFQIHRWYNITKMTKYLESIFQIPLHSKRCNQSIIFNITKHDLFYPNNTWPIRIKPLNALTFNQPLISVRCHIRLSTTISPEQSGTNNKQHSHQMCLPTDDAADHWTDVHDVSACCMHMTCVMLWLWICVSIGVGWVYYRNTHLHMQTKHNITLTLNRWNIAEILSSGELFSKLLNLLWCNHKRRASESSKTVGCVGFRNAEITI